jgi:hypothetical protein
MMKLIRVLARIAVLSCAAAAFVALTQAYAHSARVSPPDAGWRAERAHRPSAPELGKFPEVVGACVVVAICAVAGRIVLRLRLSAASRSEGQPILLGLHKTAKTAKSS